MAKPDHEALTAFLTVAREQSFTRAAAKLGKSQSALSHAMRKLEEELGVRLLSRTTRSVATTEAGKRLMEALAPRYEEIADTLSLLVTLKDSPSGNIRITTGEHAANTVLWPRLGNFLRAYPDIQIEIITEQGLTDIVAERYDAGVRFGEQVAKDMVAARIGPDVRFVAVGSPGMFQDKPLPRHPRSLVDYPCIKLRLPTRGGLYAWEFAKGKSEVNVRVEGRLTLNSLQQILRAALDGFGIAYLPEDLVRQHIVSGRLIQVLEDWCQPFSGYHLYYPSRRQHTRAFELLVDHLRWRG